jgi:tight adherence protein B
MLAAGGAAAAVAAATAQLDALLAGRAAGRRQGDQSSAEAGDPARGGETSRRAHGPAALPRGPLGHAIVAVVAGSVAWVVAGAVPGAIVAGCAWAGAAYRERRSARGASRQRERGAPAFARALADALRGGASVRGALAAAATDRSIPPPLRRELATVSGGITLGAPVDVALARLAGRGGPSLRLLCGTIMLHLEAGGALAGQLDRLATDAEAALRIDEDRIAATAQARATVRVVAALPVLALLGAEVTSSNFLSTIAGSTPALALLLCGFVLEAAAIVAARAIVGGQS